MLKVWGSQGGVISDETSGLGAYTEGIIKLSRYTKLNIYVGRQGECSTSALTDIFYNGGENSIGKIKERSCTGGGATFITYDNNVNDVIIISGSGGGAQIRFKGGYGGKIAGNGEGYNNCFGKGATISSPGQGGIYPGAGEASFCRALDGTFLRGGKSCSTAEVSSSGGGSGYYGGGGSSDQGAGGGGSSYASSVLKNVIYKNGNEDFVQPDGTSKKGHSGDGFISIEKLFSLALQTYCIDFHYISFINILSLIFISSE